MNWLQMARDVGKRGKQTHSWTTRMQLSACSIIKPVEWPEQIRDSSAANCFAIPNTQERLHSIAIGKAWSCCSARTSSAYLPETASQYELLRKTQVTKEVDDLYRCRVCYRNCCYSCYKGSCLTAAIDTMILVLQWLYHWYCC